VEKILIDSAVIAVKLWSLIIALTTCHPSQSHYVDRPARSSRWKRAGSLSRRLMGGASEQNYFEKSGEAQLVKRLGEFGVSG